MVLAILVPMIGGPLARPGAGGSAVEEALAYAEDALAHGKPAEGLAHVDRALERDAKSLRAWALRARCEEALGDADLRAHALHQELRLSVVQKRPAAEVAALRASLVAVDPMAQDLFDLTRNFVPRLRAVADQYVKDGRPHAAIRAHKEILTLDPECQESRDAIQKIASTPDPSLAGDAKPKDLLADVSAEWIRERDAAHATWEDRDKLAREHYVTMTDTGYANLVRAGEAMEQMNAFYREFFQYGAEGDGHTVPRIELRIFKDHAEYLKKGSSPADWSGGQFTGDAVETYVGEGGFAEMVGTLFHESAHQFVSLATSASGWLNEGLASFFEGTRILSNGTVLMNLPANHRLMPMVARLEKGWMKDEADGIDPAAPTKSSPPKAPTFRIVLENKYEWGPPWYAPTWAVVYFLYNYQDPVDGRFVYRAAFREFVNSSGGRVGEGAVGNFEEVVLANPAPPIPGFKRPKDAPAIALPKTVEELDLVWKDWLVALKKEQNGEIEVARPYLAWARAAVLAKDEAAARELFEKALAASPDDVETLLAFAGYLADHKGADRASKLALEALRVLESREPVDEKAVAAAEKSLDQWDPKRKALASLHEDLWAASKRVVLGYRAAGMPSMVLDLSWRLGSDLGVPGMQELYEAALREGAKPVRIWQLAYDEADLEGWAVQADSGYRADGRTLIAGFAPFDEKVFDYRVLTLDAVTSGDWSLEADVLATKGKVNFCGLVFGRKDPRNFHGLILFPGRTDASGSREGLATTGFVDLASCFGDQSFKTWRHNPVDVDAEKAAPDKTGVDERWHKLRIDVADLHVDTWFDGEFLATQDFPSADPLRGSLGLIVGPGEARFRNVRLPRAPAARHRRADRARGADGEARVAGRPAAGRQLPRPRAAVPDGREVAPGPAQGLARGRLLPAAPGPVERRAERDRGDRRLAARPRREPEEHRPGDRVGRQRERRRAARGLPRGPPAARRGRRSTRARSPASATPSSSTRSRASTCRACCSSTSTTASSGRATRASRAAARGPRAARRSSTGRWRSSSRSRSSRRSRAGARAGATPGRPRSPPATCRRRCRFSRRRARSRRAASRSSRTPSRSSGRSRSRSAACRRPPRPSRPPARTRRSSRCSSTARS
jgi:tetratricopeptide (TPR) repeat protein